MDNQKLTPIKSGTVSEFVDKVNEFFSGSNNRANYGMRSMSLRPLYGFSEWKDLKEGLKIEGAKFDKDYIHINFIDQSENLGELLIDMHSSGKDNRYVLAPELGLYIHTEAYLDWIKEELLIIPE